MAISPTVKVKTKTAAAAPALGSGMVSLSGLSSALDSQTQATAARQKGEMDAANRSASLSSKARRDANAVSTQSMQSADANRTRQLEVLNGVNGQITKAQEAMKLSDSDNPLDRLQLYFLQQTDPSYTRDGNMRRMEYLQAASGALGSIEAINQEGYQDSLSTIKNTLDMNLANDQDQLAILKLAEGQGAERIQAEQQAAAARLGQLQNHNAMQEAALVNMTPEQVASATQQAVNAPTGTVNVGGVDLSLNVLKERGIALEERAYNKEVIMSNRQTSAVQHMTAEDVAKFKAEASTSKKRTADVNGVQVPLGILLDREYDLNNQDANRIMQQQALAGVADSLVQKAQRKEINTMEPSEINTLISGGGIDSTTGVQYDLATLREIRDVKTEARVQQITEQAMNANLGSPAASVTQTSQYVNSIKALPGTPLANTVAAMQRTVNYLASDSVINNQDPIARAQSQEMLNGVRANIDTAITAESERLANGNKPKAVAYGYQLRGQPIPADLVKEVLQDAATKNEVVGNWLTGSNNALFKNTFYAERNRLMTTDARGNKMDKESAEAQAFDTALREVTQAAAGPIADEIMAFQLQEEGHPLKGKLSAQRFLSILNTADNTGATNYAAATQVSDEELASLRRGDTSSPEFEAAQAAALYMQLEQIQPDLGQQYVAWWGSDKRTEMVARYGQGKAASVAGDFTKLSELSLVMPNMDAAFGQYGQAVAAGQQLTFQNEIQRQHAEYISFGNNMGTKQAFLLEQYPELSPSDKKDAMTNIFQPLIEVTKQNQMPADQATQFIETSLRTMQPENKAVGKILKTILTGRDSKLKIIEDFAAANRPNILQQALGVTNGVSLMQLGQSSNNAMQSQVNTFDWYQEIQGK